MNKTDYFGREYGEDKAEPKFKNIYEEKAWLLQQINIIDTQLAGFISKLKKIPSDYTSESEQKRQELFSWRRRAVTAKKVLTNRVIAINSQMKMESCEKAVKLLQRKADGSVPSEPTMKDILLEILKEVKEINSKLKKSRR